MLINNATRWILPYHSPLIMFLNKHKNIGKTGQYFHPKPTYFVHKLAGNFHVWSEQNLRLEGINTHTSQKSEADRVFTRDGQVTQLLAK